MKSPIELQAIIRGNPLAKDSEVDPTWLHVTFLSGSPPKSAVALLQPLSAASEQFRIGRQEIYLDYPDGYGRSRLSNTAIEKRLSVVATTRNWKTVNALLALAR